MAAIFDTRPWLKRRPALRRLLQEAAVLCAVNLIAFVVIMVLVGADALSGHVENGHYFLRLKGQVTEVSRDVFLYSKWHAISVYITFPLMFAIGALLYEPHRSPGSVRLGRS